MPDFDASFKIVARNAGAALPRLAGLTCQRWQPLVDTLQAATERLADRAFRATQGNERFIVYMEAYTRWDKDTLWNVLAKSGLLSERERLPTVCLLFVLLPDGYQPQDGEFVLSAGGSEVQVLRFREVCLWQVTPEAWWENHPGLMALYPLCRHRGGTAQAVAHAAGSIQRKVRDTGRRADLLTILGIFGRLADRGTDVISIIGREQMRESPFYQQLLGEGKVLGELQRGREDILQVLRLRFGQEAAQECLEALTLIEDPERLKYLHQQAVVSRRYSQFRRALEVSHQ